MGKRVKYSDQERAEVLSRIKNSGLSVQDACSKEGIAYSQYYKWKEKLNGNTAYGKRKALVKVLSDIPSPVIKLRKKRIETTELNSRPVIAIVGKSEDVISTLRGLL